MIVCGFLEWQVIVKRNIVVDIRPFIKVTRRYQIGRDYERVPNVQKSLVLF